jgi:hypothetical protein
MKSTGAKKQRQKQRRKRRGKKEGNKKKQIDRGEGEAIKKAETQKKVKKSE